MWNPYEKPLNKTDFNKNKDNLAKLLQFNYLDIKKNYFIANYLYYSINTIWDYPLFINDLWGACLFSNEQTIIWNINPLNYDKKNNKQYHSNNQKKTSNDKIIC